MNPSYWRNPFKGPGVPRGKPIEVVIQDEFKVRYVTTAIWDGEDWLDPSGYKFEDYGHTEVLYWREASHWPGKEEGDKRCSF